MTALSAADVEYVPPPLGEGTIVGLPAVLELWRVVLARWPIDVADRGPTATG